MFKPPISQVRVRAPTNVHFTLAPSFSPISKTAFATLTAEFDADILLYTYAVVVLNGVMTSEWASTSAGPTGLLVTNVMFGGASVGDVVSMWVKHTVVSGGGYPTDSDWSICPETFLVEP